ncbi:MAG TPA: deoxyhypusine synthase [Candidatus Bathyarchaeia archaeon]|nr:deoxyhypusine synthase [Candidatus Bathyarchaeia archaeon]
MKREDYLREYVSHMKIDSAMTVNQLIQKFDASGSFGAGRVATACDIFEKMVRDKNCTVFLTVAGAIVPAGLRTVIADLMRKKRVDVVVSTAANMVHDLIEAFGGHHYKGHWLVDDYMLYKYHIYRIYDIFVTEEDYIKLDSGLSDMFEEINAENKDRSLASHELVWEIGKRLKDPNSIMRAAYETKTPLFLPAIRDSELGFVYWLYQQRTKSQGLLQVDAFKEVSEIMNIASDSQRLGMVVLGGGVPRNTVQHAAVTAKRGLDYAVIITMDRAETGGLSGSTLEETISWGKVKRTAQKVMVIGDVLIVFPLMVAALEERLNKSP